MWLKNKIYEHFKINKFRYVCDNEQEWIDIQKYLLTKGYYWETSAWEYDKTRTREFSDYIYPRIIQNFRTGDRFGGKHLIITNQHWTDKCSYPKASKYLRKQKLKKLL